MKKTLLLGWGNPDRQDDGVAWHVLRSLAQRLGVPAPGSYEDEFPAASEPSFVFTLQLTPELAEELVGFDRVCFVDAHTGNVDKPVNFVPLNGEFQTSPFTHHLTPQSLLSICQTVYHASPEAVLLSIRGYRFEFQRDLSPETAALLPQAVEAIHNWL